MVAPPPDEHLTLRLLACGQSEANSTPTHGSHQCPQDRHSNSLARTPVSASSQRTISTLSSVPQPDAFGGERVVVDTRVTRRVSMERLHCCSSAARNGWSKVHGGYVCPNVGSTWRLSINHRLNMDQNRARRVKCQPYWRGSQQEDSALNQRLNNPEDNLEELAKAVEDVILSLQ